MRLTACVLVLLGCASTEGTEVIDPGSLGDARVSADATTGDRPSTGSDAPAVSTDAPRSSADAPLGCAQGVSRPEECNGLDDDCNGRIDDDCRPCIDLPGSDTPWQQHLGEGPTCFGRTFDNHGTPEEYTYATIPPEGDPGWTAHASDTISFDDPSTLCGVCECRAGADFTYFQTTFYVPSDYDVRTLSVNIGTVDDGVSVTVFNSVNPTGVVDPGAYAYLGGGSTSDLARYVVPGRNRVVLTHVDDCCMVRAIRGATITLNGTPLTRCALRAPG